MKFNRNLHYKKKNEAFVTHFRLLGLKRGECRSEVIRSAAQAMSIALSYSGDRDADDHLQHSADDVRRAKIALAAYRLLDPRGRADVYERVQLCYPIDRDGTMVSSPSNSQLVDQMVKVPQKIGRPGKSIVKLMGQPVIDEAIDGNPPADEEPDAAGMNASAEQINSDPSLDERRKIVRLMRESDESTLRLLSPIGWLRSRLGI